ncbi:hypothetical protein DPV78_012574 [Talaromyces pinophilus]|nr:hypothetical protein DPV78_012574 [Talaromyces pinophilus]
MAKEKYYTLSEINEQIECRKGWERRRYEWEMSLIDFVARNVADEPLRETLAMPPSARDEDGIVDDEMHVWGWVPCGYKGLEVTQEFAKEILADATIAMLHERFTKLKNYVGIYYGGVEDGYRRIYINYVDEEPELPDYLKDLPILKLQKWEPLMQPKSNFGKWLK